MNYQPVKNLWQAKCCINDAKTDIMSCMVGNVLALKPDVEKMLSELMEIKTIILNVENTKENTSQTVAEAYQALTDKAKSSKNKANC